MILALPGAPPWVGLGLGSVIISKVSDQARDKNFYSKSEITPLSVS